MANTRQIEQAYRLARERYAEYGVNTDKAIRRLGKVAVSLHCWQGDDVGGFENAKGLSGGGIMATGAYPGKARTPDELRADIEKALSLIPGKHRLNLHAMYAETKGKVDRNELEPRHFKGWVQWAKANGLGMDFNGTYFSHPKAADGFTLSCANERIRRFWVEHGIACRKIGAYMGRELGTPCVTNTWIPDGYKDVPVDRKGPRERLRKSLDEIRAKPMNRKHLLDAVEGKLFGIGSESYVVGSHEFYLGYAIANGTLLCLDMGHFHPTESVADKISAVMTFVDEILLHVSRGVRWDSDHVVILSDELQALAQELVRGDYLDRAHIGLDFFDASINRIGAYVIGADSVLKALLYAVLEPARLLEEAEKSGDYYARLALQEQSKIMPFGAVWDYWCMQEGIPTGTKLMDEIRRYERDVLMQRT